MSDETSKKTALAVTPTGNPDGKGCSETMLDWYRAEPRGVAAKPRHQILAELFTSMLVLNASFKYKPAIGVKNYLFFVNDSWRLSLIAPEQWSGKHQSGFVGTCEVQPDMTWTIDLSEQLLENESPLNAVAEFFDAFAQTLDTDLTLEEILPFYVRRMPYWQRLYASGLSRSVRAAVTLGGQDEIKARDWRLALPADGKMLLLESTAK